MKMRNYQQMMDAILGFAHQDERVRMVVMNGSRTNPNVPKDMFQDYDIVYIVNEMESFTSDPHWIDVFGERIMMQTPEIMPMFPSDREGRFSYLMLFADGNRIDLTLVPVADKETCIKADKLTIILLDKEGAYSEFPAPSDEDYWVKRPTADFFTNCCNEFWWVSTYVAKGLWRKEILYAHDHLNLYVRPMLIKMLEWQVGIETDFSLSTGKNGKYLEKYLPAQSWEELLTTYADGSYEGVWNALFAMGNLFRKTAENVAHQLNYKYSLEEDQRVTNYLKHVRHLSPSATQIYGCDVET